jgi:hypothetical protein
MAVSVSVAALVAALVVVVVIDPSEASRVAGRIVVARGRPSQ